jgi:hypothetical protein
MIDDHSTPRHPSPLAIVHHFPELDRTCLERLRYLPVPGQHCLRDMGSGVPQACIREQTSLLSPHLKITLRQAFIPAYPQDASRSGSHAQHLRRRCTPSYPGFHYSGTSPFALHWIQLVTLSNWYAYPYTITSPSVIDSSCLPAFVVPRRRQMSAPGCNGGIDCPYPEEDSPEDDYVVDYPFLVCADPSSPLCFRNSDAAGQSGSTVQVVPLSFASTATIPGHLPTDVPDFRPWASSAISAISQRSAAMSSRLAMLASVSSVMTTATPTPGNADESVAGERDPLTDDEDWATDEATTELEDDPFLVDEMEPYYDAAFVVVSSASPSTSTPTSESPAPTPTLASTGPLDNSIMNEASFDDRISSLIAGMRRGVKAQGPRGLGQDFEQLMSGKFGDDWFAAFSAPPEPLSSLTPASTTRSSLTMVQPSATLLSATSHSPSLLSSSSATSFSLGTTRSSATSLSRMPASAV